MRNEKHFNPAPYIIYASTGLSNHKAEAELEL